MQHEARRPDVVESRCDRGEVFGAFGENQDLATLLERVADLRSGGLGPVLIVGDLAERPERRFPAPKRSVLRGREARPQDRGVSRPASPPYVESVRIA